MSIKLTILLLFLNFSIVFNLVKIEIQKSKLKDNLTTLTSINTSLGTLIGYKKEVQNQTINVFYGVPYAFPPIGKLRFRKTKLINKFPNEPYSALNFKPHCLKKKHAQYHPTDTFSEDCLYLNIWTPNLTNDQCSAKYPVMIYIFAASNSIFQMAPFLDEKGQSHLSMSGEMFPALHDTILVTLNYRVELFASLYLLDELPANLGLFDQNLAIQWVHKYINDLCGDEQRITLFGHSYGSKAVGLHIISKYSNDLINNAIMQSNSPLFNELMPITRNEIMINSFLAINELNCLNLTSSKIGDHVGNLEKKVRTKYFYEENLREKFLFDELHKNWFHFESKLNTGRDYLEKDDYIDKDILLLVRFLSRNAVDLDCIEKLSAQQIRNIKGDYINDNWSFYYDDDFIDEKAYLNYKLFNKLNLNPKINLLIGSIKEENFDQYMKYIDKYPNDQFNAPAIPKDDAKELIKKMSILTTDNEDFASEMADYYTDETKWKLSKGYFESILNLVSDHIVKCPIHFFANFAAMTANSVSCYDLTYQATKHYTSQIMPYDLNDYVWIGPSHGDELFYLFGWPWLLQNHFTDLDREFSLKLIELWATFARDGKMPDQRPSGKEWPVATKHHPRPRYVEINNKFTREINPEQVVRCEEFWRPLLPLYKR